MTVHSAGLLGNELSVAEAERRRTEKVARRNIKIKRVEPEFRGSSAFERIRVWVQPRLVRTSMFTKDQNVTFVFSTLPSRAMAFVDYGYPTHILGKQLLAIFHSCFVSDIVLYHVR